MTTFMKKITLEQWTIIPGNPRQRDTERHANGIEEYLKVPDATQATVAAAQLPNGDLVKLDGHTRCFLWDANRIPVPMDLSMVIYPVSGMEEAMRLYDKFDSSIAVENKRDKVFGAFREYGIYPKSRDLQKGTLAYTLFAVETGRLGGSPAKMRADVNPAILEWKHEILCLDRLVEGHTPKKIPSGVKAAIMLTIRRHGYFDVVSFWQKYLDPERNGSVNDAHNALLRYLENTQNKKATQGREAMMNLVSKGLSACENGIVGNPVRGGLKGLEVATYLHRPSRSLPSARPVNEDEK